MSNIAIIQARMGSSRLPGKILCDIEGVTMLQRIIDRVSAAKTVDRVIVATTVEAADDAVESYIRDNAGADVFRGPVDDVLTRYYECAKKYTADIVIRVTADDPLKDPEIIDYAVNLLVQDDSLDYCSNTIEPSFPEGLDIEVFRFEALEAAYFDAKLLSEREHVTPYIWKNPELFRIRNFIFSSDLSTWRWTVDKPQDLEFMRCIFKIFKEQPLVSYKEVIQLLKDRPELMDINAGTIRNEGYIKSLTKEN